MIKEISCIGKKFLSKFSHIYKIPKSDIQEFEIKLDKETEMTFKEKVKRIEEICEAIDNIYTMLIGSDKILLTVKSENENMINCLSILFNELSNTVVRL